MSPPMLPPSPATRPGADPAGDLSGQRRPPPLDPSELIADCVRPRIGDTLLDLGVLVRPAAMAAGGDGAPVGAGGRPGNDGRMRWYQRLVWPFPRGGQWPDRPPPTVPGGEPVIFHCPRCKQVVEPDATDCAVCGTRL
jgi:hypothetical protein